MKYGEVLVSCTLKFQRQLCMLKHAGWLGYHLDSMQALSAGHHSVDMSTEDNNQNDHSLLS